MVALNSDRSTMQDAIESALGAHWRLILFHALILLVLGAIAIAAPVAATIAVDVFVGWLFLFSGITGLIAMLSAKKLPAFLWSLITAALSVALGILLVWKPVQGAISLTLALTAFLAAEGIFQSVTSVAYRKVMSGSWGWMLVSGIADLLLAAIIILGWPITAVWSLGLIVGVNLISSGWALVMTALAGRKFAKSGETPAAAAGRKSGS